MTASTRRELRSAATSTSTTAIDLIRALTDARPIKPTSTRCLSARRPNPGRGSTYRRGNSVQTTAATSHFAPGPGGWRDHLTCASRWTASPLRPSLSFRYAQVARPAVVRSGAAGPFLLRLHLHRLEV